MTSIDAATITVPDLAAPVELLARVLGVGFADLVSRMVSDGLDAALADPDVRAAYDALARLDNRRNNAPEVHDSRGSTPPPHADSGPVSGEDGNGAHIQSSRARKAAPSTKAAQLSPTERHDIGHAVREKRIARGLSQRQVAAELGISAVALGYVEAGAKKASAKLVAACESWATKPHPCDVKPHVATRRLPRTVAPVEPAASEDDEPATPRTKSVTPEATRRLAASKVREARNTAGLTIASAAAVIGIDELVMLAIESAHQVDAGDLRKACAWAQ